MSFKPLIINDIDYTVLAMRYLESLLTKCPRRDAAGICYNLSHHLYDEIRATDRPPHGRVNSFISLNSEDWAKYSGVPYYPIPAPEGFSSDHVDYEHGIHETYYDEAEDLWDEYGAGMRRSLIEHILNKARGAGYEC